ncbi:MAG: nitrogenase component I subunit alpha [Coriobacteriales bacterium]|jgi:nitrogenase molybdenum-iron protein alpha chain|nr:nitrogenase component I subunit alpha [Coriobacteriales bacterium]
MTAPAPTATLAEAPTETDALTAKRASATEAVLDKYSARVFKKRKTHVVTVDNTVETPQQIEANVRTIPGLLSHRGCCFAGCKGVVIGPIKDALTIVHGPIGCSFYTWGTRRHRAKADPEVGGGKNFVPYCFSTDMQEGDIVFGGEKKLRRAIDEAMEIFQPETIFICSTCPVGLIGDDIAAVAAEAEAKYGITCTSFSCEGYKGVSQSAGHHIANNGLIKQVIGTGDRAPKTKYSLNILGEYNIGGDGWEIARALKRIGYEIVSVFTGDGAVDEIRNAHLAELNIVQCHRSINYRAEMMNAQYGTPWLKVNFIGISATSKSLRDIARYFADAYGDTEIVERTEQVIADEIADIQEELDYYHSRLEGKKAFLYVGGSRSHHYQKLLRDFGMATVLAGYEFAHRDDYEGRQVIPDIKIDADSKNIENLELGPVEGKYRIHFPAESYARLRDELDTFEFYAGMMREMDNGAIVVDDLNHFETEEFMKMLKPDVFFSGIKDKFVAQKSGVLSRQLHSYDYSGPYAGFKGAVNFGRDVSMGIYTPAWGLVTPPWKNTPVLTGTLGGE